MDCCGNWFYMYNLWIVVTIDMCIYYTLYVIGLCILLIDLQMREGMKI